MTWLDWAIVAFALLMAFHGYARGFVVGALSLAGFAAGVFVGTRLGPELLPEGSASPYAPMFGLLGALTAGMILASGLEAVGFAVRRRLGARRAVNALDGLLGSGLTAALALGLAWLCGAVALQSAQDRDLRRTVQRSLVLRELNAVLPPSGPILNALARFDPFPQIQGPPANVGPPNSAIARDPQVRAAGRGVVQVLGTACGLGISGSGWVARPGVVVTNAHVVAGTDDATVQAGGEGERLDARTIHFDPTNDVAVLAVDGLDAPGLRLAGGAGPGTSGAVLGFPENGPYDVAPARLGSTRTVVTQDAYGRGPVRRSIVTLRANVRPGNSGGPMVDGAGRVLTTVFAATVGRAQRGGYGVPNAIVRRALARARGPVGTGPCAR
ncbi:MAG TPA: MarP family serine protease [Solirubrobacteraceae bacterium]|nr:MarP family serine protease [Solirubrobacteraceae bacterium]